MIEHEEIDDGPITSKLHKVCCCYCYIPCNFLWHPCRKAVSGKKRRYNNGGFDLDLAYITPRIIVHGFPASGLEHTYRNPRLEIRRFLDTYHKDQYKMYNFCCEYGRGYDPAIFYGRVERYPFKDHNTPPLETMVAFANSAKAWLEEDPKHVVNMHCKAGKGRAGLMSCVLLVRVGAAQSAKEALDLYDRERVTNNKGLTVTSQRKFVMLYEMIWRQYWKVTSNIGDITAEEEKRRFTVPEQPERALYGVELMGVPEKKKYDSLRVQVYVISNFLPKKICDTSKIKSEGMLVPAECALKGSFKIVITGKTGLGGYKKVVELLHNTLFMDK